MKYLADHKLTKRDASYIRTSEEDRLSEYVKAIPLLTIDPNHRLRQENQELKTTQLQEIARLKWREGQQAQEIADLRLQLKEVQPKQRKSVNS